MSKQIVVQLNILRRPKKKYQCNRKISSNFSGLDLIIATFLAKQIIVGRAGRYKAALGCAFLP